MVIHPTTDCWKAGLAHAATPAPKAATTYEPCAGKDEGATCRQCAPWDFTCIESAVVKTCQAGECKMTPTYEPCADKAEGATCKECAPHDSFCSEAGVVKTF